MRARTEAELLDIEPDTVIEGILFRTIPQTLDTLPKEQELQTIQAEEPVSNEWSWFTYFTPQFYRDFNNLGGVKEKSTILRCVMDIQKQPDIQIKDIQKPYSGNLKGK